MANPVLIQGEFGVTFVLGTSFDMSAQTGLQFCFLKPDCVTELRVTGTLGTTQLVTPLGTFAANQWAQYVFADGDLDQTGTWQVQLRFTSANMRLASGIAEFDVVPALCDITVP